MPALHYAHHLFQSASTIRWAVEARLLSNEPLGEISRKCNLSTQVVECYEKTFFNVLDFLHCETWIVCEVIGRKVFTGLTEEDVGVLWKIMGYSYGPLVLDSFIHGRVSRLHPNTVEQVHSDISDDATTLLLRKRAIASQLLRVTPETAPLVLKLIAELREIESRTAANVPVRQEPAEITMEAALHDLAKTASQTAHESAPAACPTENEIREPGLAA